MRRRLTPQEAWKATSGRDGGDRRKRPTSTGTNGPSASRTATVWCKKRYLAIGTPIVPASRMLGFETSDFTSIFERVIVRLRELGITYVHTGLASYNFYINGRLVLNRITVAFKYVLSLVDV